MPFINESNNEKTKILYIMGATWHTRSMFGLSTVEDNFSKILCDKGITNYTFDISKHSHNDNIILAKELINKYNIKYVLGYSYGAIVASELANESSIKGLFLLDPYAQVTINSDQHNDTLVYKKEEIQQALIVNDTNIKDQIKEDHINSICPGDTLESPAYPKLDRKARKIRFVSNLQSANCVIHAFFTKHSRKEIRDQFPTSTLYQDASHWILLEDYRYNLAEDISRLIDKLQNQTSG